MAPLQEIPQEVLCLYALHLCRAQPWILDVKQTTAMEMAFLLGTPLKLGWVPELQPGMKDQKP